MLTILCYTQIYSIRAGYLSYHITCTYYLPALEDSILSAFLKVKIQALIIRASAVMSNYSRIPQRFQSRDDTLIKAQF